MLATCSRSLPPSAGVTTSSVETHRESTPFVILTHLFLSACFPTCSGGQFLLFKHLTLVFRQCSVPIRTFTGCRPTWLAFASMRLFGRAVRNVARNCTVAFVFPTLTLHGCCRTVLTTILALLYIERPRGSTLLYDSVRTTSVWPSTSPDVGRVTAVPTARGVATAHRTTSPAPSLTPRACPL